MMITTDLNINMLANNPFGQHQFPNLNTQQHIYARSASSNNIRSHSTINRQSEREQTFTFPQVTASNYEHNQQCPPLRLVLSDQTNQIINPIIHPNSKNIDSEFSKKRSQTPNSHVPMIKLTDESFDYNLNSNRNRVATKQSSMQNRGQRQMNTNSSKIMFNLRKSIQDRQKTIREEGSQIILSYICHLDRLIQQGQKVFDLKQRKSMIVEDNLSRQLRTNNLLNEIQCLENKVETLKNQDKWNTFEYDVKKFMEFIQKDIKIIRMNSEIEIKKRQLGNIHKLLAHLQVQYNAQKEKFLSLVEQINTIGQEKEIQVMEEFIKSQLVIGGKQLYDLMITVFDYKLMKQKVLIKEIDEYYSLRVCKLPSLVIIQQVQNLIIQQIEANFRSVEQQNFIVSSIYNSNKAYDPANKTLSQAYSAMLTFEKYGNQLSDVKKQFETKSIDIKKEIENLIEQVDPLNNEELISFLKTFTNLQHILNMFFTSFKKFHTEGEQEKLQSLILTHLKIKQEYFAKIVETVSLYQPKIQQMESLIYTIRVTILKMQCFGTETQQLSDTLKKTIEEKLELEQVIKQTQKQDIFPKKDVAEELFTDRQSFLKRTRSDFFGMLSRSNANFLNQFDSTINSQQKKDLIIQKAEKIKEQINKLEKIRRDNQKMLDEEMKGDMMSIDIQVRGETLEMFRMVEEIFKDNIQEQNLIQHMLDNDFPYVLQITNYDEEIQFALSPKNIPLQDIANKIKNQPRSQNQISYSNINNPNSTFSTTISSNTQDILQLNSPNTNRFPFSDTSLNLNRNPIASINLQDQQNQSNRSNQQQFSQNSSNVLSSPLYFTQHFQNLQQKSQTPISLLTSNNLDNNSSNNLDQKDSSISSSSLIGSANESQNPNIFSTTYRSPTNKIFQDQSQYNTNKFPLTSNVEYQSNQINDQNQQKRQKSYTGHDSSNSSSISSYLLNKFPANSISDNSSIISNYSTQQNPITNIQRNKSISILGNSPLTPSSIPQTTPLNQSNICNNYYLNIKPEILSKSPLSQNDSLLSSNNISILSNQNPDSQKSNRNPSDLNLNGSNFVSMKNPLASYMMGNNANSQFNEINKQPAESNRNNYFNDASRNNSFVQSRSYYSNDISRNNISNNDISLNQDLNRNQQPIHVRNYTNYNDNSKEAPSILIPQSTNTERSNTFINQNNLNKANLYNGDNEESVKRQQKDKFYLSNREDKENIQISNPLNNINNSSNYLNRSSSQITNSRSSQKQLDLKSSNKMDSLTSSKLKPDILNSKIDSKNSILNQYNIQPQIGRKQVVNYMQFGNPQQSISINEILKDSTNSHYRNNSQQLQSKPAPKINLLNSNNIDNKYNNAFKYDNAFKILNPQQYNSANCNNLNNSTIYKNDKDLQNENVTPQEKQAEINKFMNISIPSNSLSYSTSHKNSEIPSSRMQDSNQYLTSFITTNPPTITNIQEDSVNTFNQSRHHKSSNTSIVSDLPSKNNQLQSFKDDNSNANNFNNSNQNDQNCSASNQSQSNYIHQCYSEYAIPQQELNNDQTGGQVNLQNSLDVTFQQLDNEEEEEDNELLNSQGALINQETYKQEINLNAKDINITQLNNTNSTNNTISNNIINTKESNIIPNQMNLTNSNCTANDNSIVISPQRQLKQKLEDSQKIMVKHASNSESCLIKDYKVLYRQQTKRYENFNINVNTSSWNDAKVIGFFDFLMSFDIINKQIILRQEHFQIQIPISNIEKLIIPSNVLSLLKNNSYVYTGNQSIYLLQLHVASRGLCEIIIDDYQSCIQLVKDFQKIFN